MKTIHQILIEVKKQYLKKINKGFTGLCAVANYSEDLSYYDKTLFRQYLRNEIKNRKVFYRPYGEKTDDRRQYVWKLENQKARIKWLDKHIKRTEIKKLKKYKSI